MQQRKTYIDALRIVAIFGVLYNHTNRRGYYLYAFSDARICQDFYIGIATLATPVEFGSEANDPVKYLFCLSARNNTEHLDALADLAERLEDQEFFKMLDQATDPKEVLDYLSK